ncbi:MAG: methyltransferase domain-containing protein [Fimbriimonadaceae bacterium]|nr:methyltransferase domain-containing protein [Chitinophagales bacterium]
MQFPKNFIENIMKADGFDEEQFIKAHDKQPPVSIRLNPIKPTEQFSASKRIPWCDSGYYLPERPIFTLDPLLHAGVYYVQEASSMFLEHVLKNVVDLNQSLKILDLCAAPGGKSTLITSLLNNESILVSNDAIRSRVNVLKENMSKWGYGNVVITNNDPADFSKLKNYFDVIVVDAPCSGSGLFRKDKHAMDEWSEENVLLCSKRQKRILEDILPALKENGFLIYATCSYSIEEDELIVKYLIEDFGLRVADLEILDDWNIVKNDFGFRFYPDKLDGEGFFLSVLRKVSNTNEKISAEIVLKERDFAKADTIKPDNYIRNPEAYEIVANKNFITAYPKNIFTEIQYLYSALRVIKAGIYCGEIKGKDFIPSHELALSEIIHENIPSIEVDKETAVQYLRKQEVPFWLLNSTTERGWCLIKYENRNLGWIKILENRVNNYYPVEWRIRL